MSKKLLNKEQAAAFLDISVRTLQRHMSARRIGFVVQPGKTSDVTMFDRAELRRFKLSQSEVVKAVVPSIMPSDGSLSDSLSLHGEVEQGGESQALVAAHVAIPAMLEYAPPDFWSRLADKLAARAGAPAKPAVLLSEKLMLTLREAVVLSGIPESRLREAIKSGDLKRHKGIGRGEGKLRRDELEKYIKKL